MVYFMENSTKMDDSCGYPDDLAKLCQSMILLGIRASEFCRHGRGEIHLRIHLELRLFGVGCHWCLPLGHRLTLRPALTARSQCNTGYTA